MAPSDSTSTADPVFDAANALRQLGSRLSPESAARHKILALAVSRGWAPSEWTSAGRARLIENARRESIARSVLSDLARRLERRMGPAIRVGLLKGAALWGDLYRLGEREASDLDLFVADDDRVVLLRELAAMGFDRVSVDRGRAANFKTLCAGDGFGDLTVEVHTRLWWREQRGFAWRWREAEIAPFIRLSAEDQMIHLAGHWIAQHTMISLHWWLDILLFAERHALDWDALEARADELRLKRSVRLARELTHGFAASSGLARVDLDFLAEPKRNLARYLWLKHAVQDSWREPLLYNLDWLGSRLT